MDSTKVTDPARVKGGFCSYNASYENGKLTQLWINPMLPTWLRHRLEYVLVKEDNGRSPKY